MPELPDVEVFRRRFEENALDRTVDNVSAETSVLEGLSEKALKDALLDVFFVESRRHGKYMFSRYRSGGSREGESWLVMHFGMTGYLQPCPSAKDKPPHTRMLVSFKNDGSLAFSCQRKLGRIHLSDEIDRFLKDMKLGPDALADEMDSAAFRERIVKSRGALKSTLMNQSLIAGIGNIYSDEILYHARIHPRRKPAELSDAMLEKLYEAMRYVLNAAIDAEVDPGRMPADFLLPRRQPEALCPCGGRIEKITLSGRHGYYCPICQTN